LEKVRLARDLGSARLLKHMRSYGATAHGAKAVVLQANRFESPHNSRPSMLCLCRASCFCRLQSGRWLKSCF